MTPATEFSAHWKEIAKALLTLGATAYGGPAIVGIMQSELQQKRRWVSKDRFVEGLSVVNLLPGPLATQLGIFLGYARGGWLGGLLAGLCFVVPGFVVMLALTLGYAALGVTPVMRGALYGLGPVVLGVFLVAVYRLGRTACASVPQAIIAVAAAAALSWTPFGLVAILVLAGAAGLAIFHSRKLGALAFAVTIGAVAVGSLLSSWSAAPVASVPRGGLATASLPELGVFFLKVGAFTFGGGLAMLAFIQDQVVHQLHWLTPQEFIDGLALGQLTPGPILMVAAYVGYKIAGVAGAVVSAGGAFLPSFILLLAVLPVFDRVRELRWMRAAIRGIGPAVIGVLAVSLVRLAPYAVPDAFAGAIFVAAVVALLAWRVGVVKLALAGALAGVVRSRWWSLAVAPGGNLS